MLLDSESEYTETNCNAKGQSFSIKASPIAFDILCSKLYTNPILAIVRELLTNAYDSQKLAGNEDTPIYVHLPNYMDSNFVIRDYGTGLSKEDVLNMYTSFFTSTKSSNNDLTGCFGLGSKTPFSYASTFSIVSYYKGIKYTFVATKKDGYPYIYDVSEEPTEEVNGLQITIPSNTDCDRRFAEELNNFVKYVPEIKIKLHTINNEEKELEIDTSLVVNENIKLYPENYLYENTYIIKQGQNTYKIDKYDIHKEEGKKKINLFSSSFTIVYEVPIGTLSIPPSREMLSKEGNEEKIKVISQEIDNTLKNYLKDNLLTLADRSKAFRRELLKTQNNLYFYGYSHNYSHKIPYYYPILNEDRNSKSLNDVFAEFRNTNNRLTRNNCILFQNMPNIVITANDVLNKDINKIKRTIDNYEELINDYNIVIPGIDTEEDTMFYVENVKQIKNSIWLLNNNPSYNFDIKHMTLKQFYKKYPNSKKQRELNVVKTNPYIRTSYFYLNNYSNVSVNNPFPASLNIIKSKYTPFNTFIICKDDIRTYDLLREFTRIFTEDFKNEENNLLFQSLKSKLNTDANTNIDNVYIMKIAKSNKKYFKEYQKLTLPIFEEMCYKLADNIKLFISDKDNDTISYNNIINKSAKLDRLKNFIDKLNIKKRNVIKNSNYYKLLQVLVSTYTKQDKVINITTKTVGYNIFTQVLPKYKEFFKTVDNGFYNSINTNVLLELSKSVKLRYRLKEKDILYTTDSSLVNKLLNLTKKGQTNVLFQR